MIHYFVKPINNDKIIILTGKEGLHRNGWEAFSQEQEKYYSDNPSATVWEIKNLISTEATEPVEEPVKEPVEEPVKEVQEISFEDAKEKAKEDMSEYSLNIRRKFVPDYKIANAQATLYIEVDGEGIYTLEEAQLIFNKYVRYSKLCREIYYRFVEYLDQCEDIEDINDAIEYYKNEYANIE